MCVSSSTTWPTDAKREARSKTKKQPSRTSRTASPCSFRLVILFVSITDDVPSAPSRNETEGHGRISVERQRESRRSERLGRRAIERVREKQKNLATLSSLPSPPKRRFGVCVTKEGVSSPDRSSEKSANAFLMSGAERRREGRARSWSRAKNKTHKKTRTENREGKTKPRKRVGRVARLSSCRAPAASVRANTSESTEKRRRSRPRFRRRLTGITYYSSLAVFANMDERKARSTRPTLGGGRFLLAGGANGERRTARHKKKKKKKHVSMRR